MCLLRSYHARRQIPGCTASDSVLTSPTSRTSRARKRSNIGQDLPRARDGGVVEREVARHDQVLLDVGFSTAARRGSGNSPRVVARPLEERGSWRRARSSTCGSGPRRPSTSRRSGAALFGLLLRREPLRRGLARARPWRRRARRPAGTRCPRRGISATSAAWAAAPLLLLVFERVAERTGRAAASSRAWRRRRRARGGPGPSSGRRRGPAPPAGSRRLVLGRVWRPPPEAPCSESFCRTCHRYDPGPWTRRPRSAPSGPRRPSGPPPAPA